MGAEIVVIVGGVFVLLAVLAASIRYDRERLNHKEAKNAQGDWPFPTENKPIEGAKKASMAKKTNKKSK